MPITYYVRSKTILYIENTQMTYDIKRSKNVIFYCASLFIWKLRLQIFPYLETCSKDAKNANLLKPLMLDISNVIVS